MEGTIEKVESAGAYGLPSWQEYQDILAKQTAANNAWSAEQAQKQMDFQERMSSTAHQREVADLKAAGLNPVLSAGGTGAASLAGAQANPDQSGNNALTTFLTNLVQAQNQMQMTMINAQNNMSMAQLSAETSRLIGSMSAEASRYAASQNAAASMYATDQALYRQQEQNKWLEQNPQSAYQAVISVANSISKAITGHTIVENAGKSVKAIYDKLVPKPSQTGSHQGTF